MGLNRVCTIFHCVFLTENTGTAIRTVSVDIKYDTSMSVTNAEKSRNVEDFSSLPIIIQNIRSGYWNE